MNSLNVIVYKHNNNDYKLPILHIILTYVKFKIPTYILFKLITIEFFYKTVLLRSSIYNIILIFQIKKWVEYTLHHGQTTVLKQEVGM